MTQSTRERFRKPATFLPPAQSEQDEKERKLDELFAKFPTPAPPAPKVKSQQPSISHGVEIYTIFGGGSIIINGREQSLPYVTGDMGLFYQLKEFYSIDSGASPLRSRRIG